jgi:predicted RNase H-like HicB family nuclease
VSQSKMLGELVIRKDDDWIRHNGDAYRCQVFLATTDAGFIATVATLPSVSATGGTAQEALENVAVAAAESIRRTKASGGKIPWVEAPTTPVGASVRWVIARL